MEDKNTALLITSFKGGAGKTTISVMSAISATLYHDKRKKDEKCLYNDIHYFDMDLSGSGAWYMFQSAMSVDQLYFNDFKDIYRINDYQIKVPIRHSDTLKGDINAYLMNPKVKNIGSVYGEAFTERMNANLLDTIFLDKVKNLIDHYCNAIGEKERGGRKLFIFDCSPGYNDFTQNLKRELCSMNNLSIIEIFTSTYDDSHIKKTIENLVKIVKTEVKPNTLQKMVLVDNFQVDSDKSLFDRVNNEIAVNNIPEIKLLKLEFNRYIPVLNTFYVRKHIFNPEFIDAYINYELFEELLK